MPDCFPAGECSKVKGCRNKKTAQAQETHHGISHGKLTVLPASWKYPKMILVLVQLIHLYQMGSPSEGITALCLCKSSDVNHFDKEGRNLSRMRRVTNTGSDYWDGDTVTKVWDGVWKDFFPLLVTCTHMMMRGMILGTRAGLGILAGRLVIISF
jgi:hypothetical protein